MANNPKLTNLAANAEADAVCVLLNSGILRIYGGTQAATGDTATAEAILAECTFGATAFGAAANGVATANAITADAAANNTGTATWFRCWKSDGTTKVFDGSVGVSGADLNLNSVSIQVNAQVGITSFTYTAQKG